MKAALAAAAITLAAQPYATLAFAHPPSATSTLKYGSMSATPLRATLTADELSTKSKQEQYRILGVEEEKLALGIDPDEVLRFIGTREDLISKFLADVPAFSRAEAEIEVDKFLMDGEMLDIYIKYNQRKAEDPNWEPMYAPEDNTFTGKVGNFVSQYGVYLIFGLLVKDIIQEQLKKGGVDAGGEAADVLVSSVPDVMHQLSNTLSA